MKKYLTGILGAILIVTILTACTFTVQTPKLNTADPLPKELIDSEQAKAIALEEIGLSNEDVFFEKVELDKDDGIWVYEIEFRQDMTEYEAEIHATKGTVLTMKKDNIFK